jgi:hypothetical protein
MHIRLNVFWVKKFKIQDLTPFFDSKTSPFLKIWDVIECADMVK